MYFVTQSNSCFETFLVINTDYFPVHHQQMVFITDNDYVICEIMNERLYAMALFYLTNTVCHFLSAYLPFKRCLLNDPTTRELEYCR